MGRGVGSGKERGLNTYLRLIALHPLHPLKRLKQRIRPLLQPLKNPLVLAPIKLITLFPLLRRINHHLDNTLPQYRRTQLDRHELVHLGRDLRVKPNELKVPAAVPALADHALRNRV
jgi:hypothetical protein